MNNLISFYNEMSANADLFAKYTSTGKDESGCMFAPLINTNYRAILSKSKRSSRFGFGGFAQGFSVLDDVNGVDRSEWLLYRANKAGQESEKQHTVHMEQAYFFKKGRAYFKTKRGEAFQRMLEDVALSAIEKRLLCYMMILAGNFGNTPNFLFARTKAVLAALDEQGVSLMLF